MVFGVSVHLFLRRRIRRRQNHIAGIKGVRECEFCVSVYIFSADGSDIDKITPLGQRELESVSCVSVSTYLALTGQTNKITLLG